MGARNTAYLGFFAHWHGHDGLRVSGRCGRRLWLWVLVSVCASLWVSLRIACQSAARPYVVGCPFGLTAGVGRTLLAGVCLAGEWLRLTPEK